MKTKLKASFAATALSTAGLCFTVSHALAAVPQAFDKQLIVVNKYTSVSNSELSSTLYSTEKFAQIFDKPLVKIPLDNQMSSRISQPVKKSDLFAFTTVLNDKLQQLIASFTRSSPSYSVNDEGEMTLTKRQSKTCNAKRSS